MFDYVFDMNSSQDSVYDRIARPVVTDVLKGAAAVISAIANTIPTKMCIPLDFEVFLFFVAVKTVYCA